jgi:nicotinate-nucleotide adenylyltransferase
MSSAIAFFGGTFDPIHFGHLRVCLEAAEALAASHVDLLPCARPAHRATPLANPEQRLAMLQLALQGQNTLRANRQELDRPGDTYTIDTLMALRTSHGAQQPLVWLIGADQLTQLDRWKDWQKLLDYAHLCVLTRPDAPHVPSHISAFLKPQRANLSELSRHPAGLIAGINVTALAISGTDIRRRLESQQSVRYLLPEPVLAYVMQHKLYQQPELARAAAQLLR